MAERAKDLLVLVATTTLAIANFLTFGLNHVRSWDDAECTYIVVSDLPSADLATFEHAFSVESSASETK